MTRHIALIEGDTAGPIRQVLSNADGPQNLTGAAVLAQLRENTTGALIEAACTVVDAESGLVEIPAAARAAWPAGEYSVRWIVTYVGGAVDKFPVPSTNTITILPHWTAP